MPDDLRVPPTRGLPYGLSIPATELTERFSRSSGPGGQGVNTTDSRVELTWDVAGSTALTEPQRERLLTGLGARLVDGTITLTASEHRSQRQNRSAARDRLVQLVTQALAPPAPPRRPTRPSRSARQRRLDVKKQRSAIKAGRAAPRERD